MTLTVLAWLLLAGCSFESQREPADRASTLEAGGPRLRAARFQTTIETATAAEDLDGAVTDIRRMSEYLASLTDDERRDFVAHWSEPPFELWLQQTTAKLEADAIRRLQKKSDSEE
jgi:hypothetical protein